MKCVICGKTITSIKDKNDTTPYRMDKLPRICCEQCNKEVIEPIRSYFEEEAQYLMGEYGISKYEAYEEMYEETKAIMESIVNVYKIAKKYSYELQKYKNKRKGKNEQ